MSVQGAKEPEENELRKLEGWRMWGYSSGILGQILTATLLNSYLFVFWVYAVGLDSLLVSVATAAGSIVNAINGPVSGYLSDVKKPGKLGKRRPFLLYGLPLTFICLIFVWVTPHIASEFGARDYSIAIYLIVIVIAFYINYGIIRSPYLSMLPEQSQDPENRVKISSLQGLFSILGAVLGILLPMILQGLLDNPDDIYNTPGDQAFLLSFLPIIGVIFGIAAVALTLLAFYSVDEKFHKEQGTHTDASTQKRSIKEVFSKIISPFVDPEYRKWLVASLLMNMGIRILTKILAPFFTYVLEFEDAQFVTFTLSVIPFAILGFILWTKQAKKKGLKRTYINSTAIISISLTAASVFIIPWPSKTVKVVLAFIIFAGTLSSLVGGYILPNPIISALVDEAPESLRREEGENISGTYFGTFIFTLNLANALGDIVIGAILTGDNARDPLIIAIVLPVAALMYFVSMLVVFRLKLPEKKKIDAIV